MQLVNTDKVGTTCKRAETQNSRYCMPWYLNGTAEQYYTRVAKIHYLGGISSFCL